MENNASWQERFRIYILRRLGLCRKCIRTATVGTILSWILFFVIFTFFFNRWLVGLVLIVATGFTIVWLSHIFAFYFRVLIPLNSARKNLNLVNADLSFTSFDSNHIAGEFKHTKLGLSFEAVFIQENMFLSISNLQGKELLMVEEKNGFIDESILEGEMTIRCPRIALSRDTTKRGIRTAVKQHLDEVSIRGESERFTDLLGLPDYQLLPLLSKLLGKMGITGNRFPVIMPLHLFAAGAFSFRQDHNRDSNEGAGSHDGQPDTVYRIKHPAQDIFKGLLDFFDDPDYCGRPPFIDDWYLFDAGYEDPWAGLCEACESYPNRDDNCYGMCGSGCTCWPAVCGDCCWHHGCAIHDDWCRQDSFAGDVLCYSPAALVGLHCDPHGGSVA